MTTQRKSAALAAITAGFIPLLSQAAPRTTIAAQACAQAFVASLATPEKAAPLLRDTKILDGMSGLAVPSEITLTAISTRTHRAVARGTCLLNAQGEVLSVTAEPLAHL